MCIAYEHEETKLCREIFVVRKGCVCEHTNAKGRFFQWIHDEPTVGCGVGTTDCLLNDLDLAVAECVWFYLGSNGPSTN